MDVLDILREPIEGHTDYQLDHFVTGSEAFNAWGARRQAARELLARIKAYSEARKGVEKAREEDVDALDRFLAEKALLRAESEGVRFLAQLRYYDGLVQHAVDAGASMDDQEREYWRARVLGKAALSATIGNDWSPLVAMTHDPGMRSAFPELAELTGPEAAKRMATRVVKAMADSAPRIPTDDDLRDLATVDDLAELSTHADRLSISAGEPG